jgi:SAM-dependent methyltransferase
MDVVVSLAKNRLRHDAVNIVFGAHLGFDAALLQRYTVVFLNLEQLGLGGASVSPEYLALLGRSAVIDYDRDNLAAYTQYPDDVPLIGFGHAPYLPASPTSIEERPIDLLFIGSMNDRRCAFIAEVEASGLQVTQLGSPVYGPERDALVGQAKAVLNCHHYESARFEQARAFQCMSLGTPVISERTARTQPPAQFEDSVFWLEPARIGEFFRETFLGPGFPEAARTKLAAFRTHDQIDQFAEVLAFVASYHRQHKAQSEMAAWKPRQLHIGSGKDYKLGWFNVDILASAEPDAVFDLAAQHIWPVALESETVGPVLLSPGCLDLVYANNVLEHVPDLPALMTNCLALLREGGQMVIEVPYEHASSAWQDPTHVRAMNENSWIYYTDWFWYLGWFDSRFRVQEFVYLDSQLQPCNRSAAGFMKVQLTKVGTSLSEKMTARTMQAGFGGLPDDLDPPALATLQAPPRVVWQAGHLAAPAVTRRGLAARWVVLAPEHPDQVTDNFARAMAEALVARGELAEVVLVDGLTRPALARLMAQPVAGLIFIGATLAGLMLDDTPLYRALSCPVYLYLLDSPIYDLARVPAARQFIADAWLDERLVPVLAENSYLQLWRAGRAPVLPPQSRYLPFAAFPAVGEAVQAVVQQRRLLVVGTLGKELSSETVQADLSRTLELANRSGTSSNDLARVVDRLMEPTARGNVVADIAQVLGLMGQDFFDPALQHLLCAGDSFMKRYRRMAAVRSLRGVPVDFVGEGWRAAFGSCRDFRFLGSVAHGDIARLMVLYRGVVNLDPNWEWGQHDRAYTALACGVPLLTHANRAIAEEGLPMQLVHAFTPNAPDLHDRALGLLAAPVFALAARDAAGLSWSNRLDRLVAIRPVEEALV